MKIKLGVILIAGFGTRMLPITKSVSKEMLPIIDFPAIFYQVKEAYLSGIEEIIFVVSKRNIGLVKSFFTINQEIRNEVKDKPERLKLLNEVDEIISKMKFSYVIQKERGTYGALYSARKYLMNKTFAVMYGDDLVISDTPLLKRMIDIYNQTGDYVASARTLKEEELPKFGLIEYEKDNILKNICYKSDNNPSNDLIYGRFILNSEIFKVKNQLVYKSNELQLPKAILFTKHQTRILLFDDPYFNIGNKLDYLKASIYLGLKREEFQNDLKNYLNDLKEKDIY